MSELSQATPSEIQPQTPAPVTDGQLQILSKIVSRSGPIATAGVINGISSDAQFAGAALICTAKDVPPGDDPDPESAWLFGIPLWHGGQDSRVRHGANIIHLSIQGFTFVDPDNRIAREHLRYAFWMIENRAFDLGTRFADHAKSRRFKERCSDFAQALANPSQFDVASRFQELSSFDDFFQFNIRVRVLTHNGVIEKANINLNTIGCVHWLANYIRPEHARLAEEIAVRLAR